MSDKKRTYAYEYECDVSGYADGYVEAENAEQARVFAERELSYENLHPTSEIKITRRPKIPNLDYWI